MKNKMNEEQNMNGNTKKKRKKGNAVRSAN